MKTFFCVTFFCLIFFQTVLTALYSKPAHVPKEQWQALEPYFLPEDHPIKPRLDELFSSRISLTSETLRAAGFLTPEQRDISQTIVSKHPLLKGYLVKLYADDQHNISDWTNLLKRIMGAFYTKQAIAKFHYNQFFKVPNKWIYPLPENPAPPAGYGRKNFILVVEDMKVLSKDKNKAQWAGATLTPKLLDAFYNVVQEAGLDDSIYAFNSPFCKDGKIGFIDLQRYHRWPVDFEKLTQYLSPKMQGYWNKLILNGGPKS